MGIKFRCPECDKKLHVKAFLAGKRGICPHCGGKVRIPLASTSPGGRAPTETRSASKSRSAAVKPAAPDAAVAVQQGTTPNVMTPPAKESDAARAEPAADPIGESPDAVWYVRPPSGGQYGPAGAALMRRWLDEGRIAPEALVWREGWPDWQPATVVFPSPEPEPVEPTVAESDLPPAAGTAESSGRLDLGATTRATRPRNRPASKSKYGRNVAVISILTVLCLVLLAALVYVLYNQG